MLIQRGKLVKLWFYKLPAAGDWISAETPKYGKNEYYSGSLK